MSYLYDEIFDSFENSFDDYLHGERDFYDSAAGEPPLFDPPQNRSPENRSPENRDSENLSPENDLPASDTPQNQRPQKDHSANLDSALPDSEIPVFEESDEDEAPDPACHTLLPTIRSDELMTRCYPRRRFVVDTLLTPGLTVLAGAPKVGKSWLVLHLCMQIAKGEPFLGLNVTQGSVLYIALEDNHRRLQNRVYRITDEGSPHLHFVTECAPIGDRLDEQITDFVSHYRDTRLVVIDTLQMVRRGGRELNYANDYSEVSFLKKIADYLNICILLVHHTRKQTDSDYMNEISGTNGIAGSADLLMVLKKENRTSRGATLSCTGRDIEDRELKLRLDRETCLWQLQSDSLCDRAAALPQALYDLIGYVKQIGAFEGTNTAFTNRLNAACRTAHTPSFLKKLMNQYCYELLDEGVTFESTRSSKSRLLTIRYDPPYSNDAA